MQKKQSAQHETLKASENSSEIDEAAYRLYVLENIRLGQQDADMGYLVKTTGGPL